MYGKRLSLRDPPEEELIWTLITDSIVHCLEFHEKGRIPGILAKDIDDEYTSSLSYLKAVDENMLIMAGFQDVPAMFKGIKQIIAKASRNRKTLQTGVCRFGRKDLLNRWQ